jgi:predicted nucleic acid-binding protein
VSWRERKRRMRYAIGYKRRRRGWKSIHYRAALLMTTLEGLDHGEKAALALAASLAADLVLMDDREGVRVARNKGFRVIGTLRVLDLGARRGLLDLADAFERIKRTNFRYRQEIIDELLDQQSSE